MENLLAERGINVSYEAIRYWCRKFGPTFARSLRRKRGRLGDVWFVDEVFIKIRGQLHYLWRAVDQDGDVLDILVTKRRDKRAAKRGRWEGSNQSSRLNDFFLSTVLFKICSGWVGTISGQFISDCFATKLLPTGARRRVSAEEEQRWGVFRLRIVWPPLT